MDQGALPDEIKHQSFHPGICRRGGRAGDFDPGGARQDRRTLVMSDVVPTPRSTTLQDLDLHLPPRQHFLRVLSENAESVGGTAWYIVLLDEAGPRTLIGSVGACGLPDDSGTIVIGDSQTVAVIVAERHPLQPHDAADTEFAQSLPCRYRLVHHVSLEDPLMRMFAVLGFLLDRLPVSRRLWAAVYIVASVSLGAGDCRRFRRWSGPSPRTVQFRRMPSVPQTWECTCPCCGTVGKGQTVRGGWGCDGPCRESGGARMLFDGRRGA